MSIIDFYLKNADGKIYDFSGNVIVDRYIKNVKLDRMTGAAMELEEADGKITVLTGGEKTFEVGLKSEVQCNREFVYYMKNGDDEMTYIYNDDDFSLKSSSSICPWIARVSYPEGGSDAVDTISGEVIIEGYDTVSGIDDGENCGENYNSDVFDIYKVKYE